MSKRISSMDWGMKNRISKIIRPGDGRCVMLAVDHGYFLGPTEGLEIPNKTIKPLLPFADSLMITRGILRTSVNPSSEVPIVLRVSGGTSIVGEDLSNETITTSIEEAVKLNATCLAVSIFVGSKYEHQTLASLSRLVDEGEKYGIPVVEGCPVPVIIAGGKKLPNEIDALKLTYEAIEHGATGVDMGRNIWQSNYAVAMIKSIRSIVHNNLNVQQAYQVFVEEKERQKEEEIKSI
jgi:putative autoinducer-2 (AI-2) aldolase